MPQIKFLHFSVSAVHVFSQLSLIQCYDRAGFGCLITCRGTSRQLLQRTENSHHRLRVTHTLNPVPAHEFEMECRCVSVVRNEQDDKESGKKRKARTLPTQKSSYFQLRKFQHKSLGQSLQSRLYGLKWALAFQIVLIISSIKLAMLQAAAPGNSTPSAGLDAGCTLS